MKKRKVGNPSVKVRVVIWEREKILRDLELLSMTEADLHGGSNQEPFIKELEVPTLSLFVTFVKIFMGVFAIGSLEPASIVVELDISLEIVLAHVDLCHILHQKNQFKILILEAH